MDSSNLDREQTFKFMLKASLCAAAPAIVPMMMLISSNSVSLLNVAGLGRLGIAAAGVLILFLANLFWKGRWWAGIPALIVCAGAAVIFILKIVRPLQAYFAANPINNIGDVTGPVMMLSPALVIIVISVSMGYVILRGIRMIRTIEPREVSMVMWGMCLLWAAVLVGDAGYQHSGWRYFDHPSDLIVRLCTEDKALHDDVQARLMKVGPVAVPDLLMAVAVTDPDLDCLRTESKEILIKLGPAAGQPLVDAALAGDVTALAVLRDLNLTGAAQPLWEHYRNPKRESTQKYEADLKATIEQLDPGLMS